jgi:nucleoside-diphosphate-sugar epimerase
MIIITGANGFIGSSILKYLMSKGYKVEGMVRSSSDLKRFRDINPELRFSDILDFEGLKKILKECHIVIHCAARSLDWGKFEDFENINVKGVKCVIEASHHVKTVRRIIYISSANVVGYGKRDVREDTEVSGNIKFAYSQTKLEGEFVALDLCKKYDLELIILRPSAVYGPEDWKWSYEMIKRIAHSNWPLINRGRAVFTPVYIDNICRSIELALDNPHLSDIYNITDDVTISWFEFCNKIASNLGLPLHSHNYPFPLALGLAYLSETKQKLFKPASSPQITLYRVIRSSKDFHYSCERAKNKLGYQPDTDIDAHIKKTVKWYLEMAHKR